MNNGVEYMRVDDSDKEFNEGVDMDSVTSLQKILNHPPVEWANKNYPGGIEAYKRMMKRKIERLLSNTNDNKESDEISNKKSLNKVNTNGNDWLKTLQDTKIYNIEHTDNGKRVIFKLIDGGVAEMVSSSPIEMKHIKHVN